MTNEAEYRTIWFEPPSKRLARWRKFRTDLKDQLTDDSALQIEKICEEIWKFWAAAPQVNIAIDPYDQSTWPTVWEMLYQGEFCKYSNPLGMAYTFFYLLPEISNRIMRVHDSVSNDTYSVALIDDKWVLNHDTCDMVKWNDVSATLTIESDISCKELTENR